MNPTTGVPVTRLPPGLPTVVMGDGTRCLVDNNTIWIPAGYPLPVESVVPQPTAVQPSPCSGHREMMPVCQLPVSLPSSEQHLQLMRPEAFSCALPPLDPPRPVPHAKTVAFVGTPAVPTSSTPKPNSKAPIPPKPELKPCKRKHIPFRPKPQPKPRIPKEKVRKNQPESKPYFVPQPLGAKHIKPPSKTLGNSITKSLGDHGIIKPSCKLSFTEQLKSGDSAYLKRQSVLSSTGSKTLGIKNVKDKVVSASGSLSTKSGDVTVAKESVNPDKAVDRAEPNSNDEYDVEYLYLTKLILRKKKKPTAEPSKESLSSRKRKCPDDSSEMPQAVKQARLEEPQDTLEDLEALLAEYSTSLMSGTRDFF